MARTHNFHKEQRSRPDFSGLGVRYPLNITLVKSLRMFGFLLTQKKWNLKRLETARQRSSLVFLCCLMSRSAVRNSSRA